MPQNQTPEETEVYNIIITGSLKNPPKDPDLGVEKSINILSKVAQNNPNYLLKIIKDAVKIKIDRMVPLGLAILSSKANNTFLDNKEVIGVIISIFELYGPYILLEYVEFLKSKAFGKGFGSRNQKWIKYVIEKWTEEELKFYIKEHPFALKSLIRLVHPRFVGEKGKLIKFFFKKILN